MKKKKLLALGMVAAMAATAVVGGTLAYFTDTDSDTNVFKVGKIDITQIEQERKYEYNNDGTVANVTLGEFEDNKTLIPIVGSAQGEKDRWGMPIAANYMDKIVTVQNESSSNNAYVRTFIAVPADLVAEEVQNGSKDETKNALHLNIGNRFDSEGNGTWNTGTNWADDYKWDYDNRKQFTAMIGSTKYYIECYTYLDVLEGGETTGAVITGCYLDQNVDHDKEGYFILTTSGQKQYLPSIKDGSVEILVATQAVQADGFGDANTALNEAFGEASATNHPWK